MTVKVASNANKIDIELAYIKLQKQNKSPKPQDFIGKFPFEGDSLEFQKDLR